MDLKEKINKLNYNNKEVVKTLLNIIIEEEKNFHMAFPLKYGFFDSEKDFNNFKDNLDLYDLGMLLQVKKDLNGNGAFDLEKNCIWICSNEMEVFKLGNEIKDFINEILFCGCESVRESQYNINENTINNLLKLSLSY